MIADLAIVRHPRARRARLSLDPRTGVATLTLPPRATLKPALAWAHDKAGWIAAQRAKLPTPLPFVAGTVLTVADAALTIVAAPEQRRGVVEDADRLIVGGPAETLARRVRTWLARRALDMLSADTAFYAARAGVTVATVSVGDPRARWGSCSTSGAIRYSWRLVLAPGWVRRATAAHEVAHRVHMDHSPAFHALVARLYDGDPLPARAWLRTHGAALHWVGRSA